MNNNYKNFKSETKNGGLTILLPNLEEAVRLGYLYDWEPDKRGQKQADVCKVKYDKAVKDIYRPNPEFLQKVEDVQETLVDVVQQIEPSLKPAYEGFGKRREDEGLSVDAGLLASGDSMPFLDRKESEYKVKPDKSGEGAYRILICTDVSWWGQPDMNCGVVGSFVTLLQQYRPVEVWIQQAWLNDTSCGAESGVTLFKLEFSSGYAPQQIAFWVTSPYKDFPFSYAVNKQLGRNCSGTSTVAEIPCDLWLRGDWMRLAGMNWEQWNKMLYTDKIDWVAKWLARTCKEVAIIDPKDQQDNFNNSDGGFRNL
jgi:hypothetical protein